MDLERGVLLSKWLSGCAPSLLQDASAIEEMVEIGGEHFQRDSSVVTARFERGHRICHIDISSAQRQVQIQIASSIVVKVHML